MVDRNCDGGYVELEKRRGDGDKKGWLLHQEVSLVDGHRLTLPSAEAPLGPGAMGRRSAAAPRAAAGGAPRTSEGRAAALGQPRGNPKALAQGPELRAPDVGWVQGGGGRVSGAQSGATEGSAHAREAFEWVVGPTGAHTRAH